MKTIKKVMCIFLLFIILGLSLSILAYAEMDNTEINKIIISLQNIESVKEDIGLKK